MTFKESVTILTSFDKEISYKEVTKMLSSYLDNKEYRYADDMIPTERGFSCFIGALYKDISNYFDRCNPGYSLRDTVKQHAIAEVEYLILNNKYNIDILNTLLRGLRQ